MAKLPKPAPKKARISTNSSQICSSSQEQAATPSISADQVNIAVDDSTLPFDNPSDPEKFVEMVDQEFKAPVQDCCKETISQLKKQITYLTSWQESGFSDVSKAKVNEVEKQLHKEEM